MGEQLFGNCEVCGNKSILTRTYFHYDVECECHSPNHFEIVEHCGICTPKEPEKTTVYIGPSKTVKK